MATFSRPLTPAAAARMSARHRASMRAQVVVALRVATDPGTVAVLRATVAVLDAA